MLRNDVQLSSLIDAVYYGLDFTTSNGYTKITNTGARFVVLHRNMAVLAYSDDWPAKIQLQTQVIVNDAKTKKEALSTASAIDRRLRTHIKVQKFLIPDFGIELIAKQPYKYWINRTVYSNIRWTMELMPINHPLYKIWKKRDRSKGMSWCLPAYTLMREEVKQYHKRLR